MTTRRRFFVASRRFVVCDNGEPKICETRIAFDVDKDFVLSRREYCASPSKAKWHTHRFHIPMDYPTYMKTFGYA